MGEKVTHSPLPPLNAIRAFEAAARRGSFVEAASDLHVTHWAVGKQIRLLEDWLGVPLFERRARGVALTDEGADLLTDVGPALSRLAVAANKFKHLEVTRRVSGTVRVNVLASFALRWLIPRLAEFQNLFPNVDIRLSTSSRKLRYVGAAFDIGVRSGIEHASGLRFEPLMPDRRLPACSPEILRHHPIETVGDLRRHALLHSTTTRAAWPAWLSAAGAPNLVPRRVRPRLPPPAGCRGRPGRRAGVATIDRERHRRRALGLPACRAGISSR
jgi:LysR family transcriptional regulator, glycine cleavage system transcriptional activator